MLKVLLLSGSPRITGNTMQVLQECARVIEAAGLTAEVVSLAGKRIESCTACYRCGERGFCVIDDGLNEIIEKIRGSRGLIVGTPVYFGAPGGTCWQRSSGSGWFPGPRTGSSPAWWGAPSPWRGAGGIRSPSWRC